MLKQFEFAVFLDQLMIDVISAIGFLLAANRLAEYLLLLLAHLPSIVQNLHQSLPPLIELLLYLAVRANGALDPGMLGDLENGRSLCWIVGDHFVEEVFEVFGKESVGFFLGMRFPKSAHFLLFYQLVVGISRCRLLEGRSASVHDEEDHPCCKNIYLSAVILLTKYLWGHVSLSAKLCLEYPRPVPAFQEAGEAEIRYFEHKGIGK